MKKRLFPGGQLKEYMTCISYVEKQSQRERGWVTKGWLVEWTRWLSFDIFSLAEAKKSENSLRQTEQTQSQESTPLWFEIIQIFKSTAAQSARVNRCMHTYRTIHTQMHKSSHKCYTLHINAYRHLPTCSWKNILAKKTSLWNQSLLEGKDGKWL